ncbi:MAG: HAD family hydrolase [Chloroflexi bacterium]|nr:HAD family hydrolase [Chloroflexota bacterium]MYF64453.1 HAD family hydrolase [Chloroflexota bacterium]MYK35534.1 HAD family hydrolase [Chloroflexota bacterium]
MPPLYSAALFDLDNTLWNRDAAIRATGRLLHETYPAVRDATTADEAEAKFAAFDERGLAGRERLIARTLEEWPGIGLSPEELATWYLEWSRLVLPQDPDVLPLLQDLNAAGVPWGIVTNGPSSGQHMTIRSRGLEGMTGCVIVSEEAGYRKPAPEIFRRALDCLGVPPGRDVLFVGDDVAADMVGAKGVGLSTAWVTNGQDWPDGVEPPDHQVSHVSQVGPLLLG